MKTIEKISITLFSTIILIEAIIVSLLTFGWLKYSTVGELIKIALLGEVSSKIIIVVCGICALLAIICIFFDSSETKSNDKEKQGILLQNENGKLMISKVTLENLVSSVVKGFNSVEESATNIEFDGNNSLIITVNLKVTKNVVIKDLTVNLQNKIKEAIKATSDLEVKEVNVRIRNIISVENNE